MPKHFQRGKYRDEERVIAPSLDALERAYDVLLAFPAHDTARFFTLDQHERTVATGNLEHAGAHLVIDAYNWLKFFWWTSAFKARQLTAALVDSYNNDNYLTWLILGRSALEYAAVGHYYASRIDQSELRGPIFAASKLQAFEELLLKYAHGTRFNWNDLFAGNLEALAKKFVPPESSSAINVLTAIDHLAKRDSRFRDVRIAYEMLSDFAHPNMASHASVVEVPIAPVEMHECHISARPGPMRGEFLMVASLPWVSMGIGTSVELLIGIAPLLESWLDYIDGTTHVTIDFTI